MRIGIICHDAFPIVEPFQGGLEMITALLVQELVERGHEVTSLCLKGSKLSGKMLYYHSTENLENNVNEDLTYLGSVSKSLIGFLAEDFQVIQNHSLHYQPILFGNITSTNFVTTFHTPVFPYLNLAINSVAENVNQIFVGVSKSVSRLYEETLPRVSTIYNGIDLSLWEVEYEEISKYFSWSGRICKEKGLAQIMELCIQANLNLKIAGPISNPTYFETQIEPLLKLDNFEYVGHLNQSELNTLIKHSEAYFFSSIWDEPYGLVIAEALACGVPVLANAVGAAPEILDENSGCLFNIEQPSSFNSGLKSVKKISRQDCRKRAEDFCGHHKMVDDYEALYKSFDVPHLEIVK
ncbi:MAG: glycosyltransferase [Psychroserpens sp.]|uniref:glycosyltransferase n=1 Tax=Psychroserpens sp. TaxID=2020870 RepID=UPI003CB63D1B